MNGIMGNITGKKSKSNKFDNFYEMMDYIATHYILTMDFESMSKLSEPEYCDKLVIITSDIIKKYFNDLDITYLAQRIRNGEEVNELSKEKVSFVSKDALENLDIKNDVNKSIKKKRVCIGIAKFYVKIAHIFAAILTTINPVYMYKDAEGNKMEKGLLEKENIPSDVPREVSKTNICDSRIKRLNPLQKVDASIVDTDTEDDKDKKNIYINPKVCELNLDSSGKPMMLSDEPGMSELMMLYMDDEYDYSNGTFKGMSEKMKYQFERDLKTFYKAFTGNKDMPETIKKFSDIKLRTYDKTNGCHTQDVLKNGSMVSMNDELFEKYAKNLNTMIYNAQSNQQRLLSVINELFVFVPEPYGDNKKIRVNPKLTDASLDALVTKTRNIIIELYVTCEKDFANGIDLYEAIVERAILRTSKLQIDGLLKKQADILKTAPLPQPASSEPLSQPASSEPLPQQPSSEPLPQPASSELQTSLPEQPKVEQPIPEQPKVEQPIPEQPKVEQPKVEPSESDQILSEQQKIENLMSSQKTLENLIKQLPIEPPKKQSPIQESSLPKEQPLPEEKLPEQPLPEEKIPEPPLPEEKIPEPPLPEEKVPEPPKEQPKP